ncbi:MAG: hypothetical protein ACKV2U_33260 [Bryobacteraceae bacterium]
MNETVRPAEELLWALEVLKIDYALVGSVASSAHGEPRATMDVDLLARITAPLLERLAVLLGTRFYFDVENAKEAVRRGVSFNILSMRDVTKFDFFPAGVDAFGTAQLARKVFAHVDFLSDIEVPVASPEDVVLAKLRWYDQGGRSSEKQWNDILGILRVQGERIDWGYIEGWAPQLGVADLLAKLPRFA